MEGGKAPLVTLGSRILRSPSHESVTTDLSLFSVSSIASSRFPQLRGPSPNPDHKANRPADIPEALWLEEENEVMRSCAALSSALGLQKSFSTTDISQLPSPDSGDHPHPLRSAVSDLALSLVQRWSYVMGGGDRRLDATSRSCSTWVAVGDAASQLPSPHAGPPHPHPPAAPISPADLLTSVNKKVRQNYIRRRLLTTYKALERLSQSEFNLERLEASAAGVLQASKNRLEVPGGPGRRLDPRHQLCLTVSDVERQRGKPLSKYDRNMMIFNWLHTLDDSPAEGCPSQPPP